jgi:hypothetical protein
MEAAEEVHRAHGKFNQVRGGHHYGHGDLGDHGKFYQGHEGYGKYNQGHESPGKF